MGESGHSDCSEELPLLCYRLLLHFPFLRTVLAYEFRQFPEFLLGVGIHLGGLRKLAEELQEVIPTTKCAFASVIHLHPVEDGEKEVGVTSHFP